MAFQKLFTVLDRGDIKLCKSVKTSRSNFSTILVSWYILLMWNVVSHSMRIALLADLFCSFCADVSAVPCMWIASYCLLSRAAVCNWNGKLSSCLRTDFGTQDTHTHTHRLGHDSARIRAESAMFALHAETTDNIREKRNERKILVFKY
jgi:hypothetical protein